MSWFERRNELMPKRIVIIEDDPDIAESLQICFQSDSVETQIACTGEDGLIASLDKSRPPTAIILDLLLPGMNGIELCRRLRKESSTRVTPIIFLTAKTSECDVSSCFDAGADDYLTKPFSIRALMQRIEAVLVRHENDRLGRYDDGVLKIDFVERRVFRNQVALPVMGIDFALLSALSSSRGQVKTHQQLAMELWNNGRTPEWAFDLTSQRLQHLARLCDSAIDVIDVFPNNGYVFVGAS
jgi:two-component system response regulator MtrA